MPTPQSFAAMYAALARQEMDKPVVRAKRIEEALAAHLLFNGHQIEVTVEQLFSAADHKLAIDVNERGSLVFHVVDEHGNPVKPKDAKPSGNTATGSTSQVSTGQGKATWETSPSTSAGPAATKS